MAKEGGVTMSVLQMPILFLVEKDKSSQYILCFLLVGEGSVGTKLARELLCKHGWRGSISE